jgi:hypothetical protein
MRSLTSSSRFAAVPRWSGLIHFQEVMNVSFTDGAKYEDLSKVRRLFPSPAILVY